MSGDGCVFCAIVRGEAEASLVHEDEDVLALMDLRPVTPGHLLVVPRVHSVGLDDLDRDQPRSYRLDRMRRAKQLRRDFTPRSEFDPSLLGRRYLKFLSRL